MINTHTLYEKRGKRYFPVHDTMACDGLSNGSWLITVQEGLTKVRHAIDDEKGLQVLAASTRWLEEWLREELMKLSEYQFGRGGELTAKEKRAYKAYMNVMGENGLMWMTRPAAGDVASGVIKKILGAINDRASKS